MNESFVRIFIFVVSIVSFSCSLTVLIVNLKARRRLDRILKRLQDND